MGAALWPLAHPASCSLGGVLPWRERRQAGPLDALGPGAKLLLALALPLTPVWNSFLKNKKPQSCSQPGEDKEGPSVACLLQLHSVRIHCCFPEQEQGSPFPRPSWSGGWQGGARFYFMSVLIPGGSGRGWWQRLCLGCGVYGDAGGF